jgi:hypothetical protein
MTGQRDRWQQRAEIITRQIADQRLTRIAFE